MAMKRKPAKWLLVMAGVVLLAAVAGFVVGSVRIEGVLTRIRQGAIPSDPTIEPNHKALESPFALRRSVDYQTARGSDDLSAKPGRAFRIHIIDSVTRQGIPASQLRLEQGDVVAEYSSLEGHAVTVYCEGDAEGGGASSNLMRTDLLNCRSMAFVTGMASAQGYAPRAFDFQTASMGRDEFEIELVAGGSIMIVAIDSVDEPIEGVRVVVDTVGAGNILPSEGGQTSLEGRRMEFGPDAVSGRVKATGLLGGHQFTGITGLDGSVVIQDLPVNSELSLRLVDSGRVHPLGTMVLLPGQLELYSWVRPQGFIVRGRIEGQGVALPKKGISICLTRATGSESDKHLMRGDEEVLATVRSDGDGWFEFEEIPAGTWLVAPIFVLNGPVQHRTQQHHGCLARVVSLPSMENETVELEITPPLYLLGSARQDSGSPGPQSRITAYYQEHSGYVTTKSTIDGYYSLGPLAPGLYRVEIESFSGAKYSTEWVVDWPSPSVLDLVAPTK